MTARWIIGHLHRWWHGLSGLLRLEGAPRRATGEGTGPGRRYPAARPLVLGGLLAVVAAVAMAPRVGFQYDFGALEPEYTAYEARAQYVKRASSGGDGRRNPAYIVADSAAAVPEIVEAVREKIAHLHGCVSLSRSWDRPEACHSSNRPASTPIG